MKKRYTLVDLLGFTTVVLMLLAGLFFPANQKLIEKVGELEASTTVLEKGIKKVVKERDFQHMTADSLEAVVQKLTRDYNLSVKKYHAFVENHVRGRGMMTDFKYCKGYFKVPENKGDYATIDFSYNFFTKKLLYGDTPDDLEPYWFAEDWFEGNGQFMPKESDLWIKYPLIITNVQ